MGGYKLLSGIMFPMTRTRYSFTSITTNQKHEQGILL